MANLNIPFVLLQKDTCQFKPSISGSKLVHYSQFNLKDPEGSSSRQDQFAQNPPLNRRDNDSNGGLLSYLGGVISGAVGGEDTINTAQLQAPIDFEPSKQNLLVLADELSGAIALCSHEQHGCSENVSRLLINIQPRVLLVPSILGSAEQAPGPLISHCIVRCPAPNILNASTFWLCTLHSDNRLRLWNTDDGRCISVSSPQLLVTKGLAIETIQGFPGHIFVFGNSGDLYIVDAYKMILNSHIVLESHGFASCKYLSERNMLVFCDARGAIFICQDRQRQTNNKMRLDEFEAASPGSTATSVVPSKPGQITEEIKRSTTGGSRRTAASSSSSSQATTQKSMLKFCRNERIINFKFSQNMKIGGRDALEVGRLRQSQVLAFDYDIRTGSVAVIVAQDQIEQVMVDMEGGNQGKHTRQALKQFTNETILVFAEFVKAPKTGEQMLVCVDIKCTVHIYSMADLQRPKIDLTEEELAQYKRDFIQPVRSFDLLNKCKVTDYHQIWIKDSFTELVSEHRTKEEHLQSRLDRLKEHLLQRLEELQLANQSLKPEERKNCQLFRYSHEEGVLYSFVEVHNRNVLQPQETSLLLSWDITPAFVAPAATQADSNTIVNPCVPTNEMRFSMNISNLSLFGSQSKQSEPHVPNTLINFNPQVLKSFYNSCQFRFFFTDEVVTATVIFQDKDSPSSIIGTNYGRIFMIPMFQDQQFKHVVPTVLIDSHRSSPITKLYLAYQAALHSSEDGGHLLSVSEDGTICATDLKSETISDKMNSSFNPNKHAKTSQKRRTDQFMQQKAKNMRQQRRHSVTQFFTAEDFFNYDRVRADEVFDQASFAPIKHIFRVKGFPEVHEYISTGKNAGARSTRSKTKLELPKQYYAFVTEENELFVMVIHPGKQGASRIQLIQLPLMNEPTIGVYLDHGSSSLFILDESLNWHQFCLRSHNLSFRKRSYLDALNMLEVATLVDSLHQTNEHFFRVMHQEDSNVLSYENFQKDFNKAKILKGLGTHQCLDFLNLSLSLPLNYAPQPHVLKEYTVQLRQLLALKQDIIQFKENVDSQKAMLRAINQILNWGTDQMMHSDVKRRQSCIVAMETQGNQFCGSNQQVLIANTQDMLPVLQLQMKKMTSKRENPQAFTNFFNGEEKKGQQASTSHGPRAKTEAQRKPGADPASLESKLLIDEAQGSGGPNDIRSTAKVEKQSYGMESCRWPSKILSLVHPFNLHDGMDESLEEFFNLNMPFLDFRIGIQGVDEAMSFVILKEDRNYHNERDHISKVMSLLKLSRQLKQMEERSGKTLVVENFIEQHIDPQDSTLYLGRFFNSEYWKVSPYLSTIVPAFLLSAFVSIIEYDEKEICLLSQVWLDIVHHIRHANRFKQSCASPLKSPTTLSTSVLSQLLLLQDLNISSCAKDIIFKPMLCHQSEHDKKTLQKEISDWLALVIDTYEELKTETTSSKNEDGTSKSDRDSKIGGEHAVQNIMKMSMANQQRPQSSSDNPYAGGAQAHGLKGSADLDPNHDHRATVISTENKPLSHFFGELEIKGLINVSFYAFYCQVETNLQIGQRDLDRVSKLVVILIREVVQQFQDRKDYIHLLTILLYLLQCNLKTATANFKRKAIMEDVVRLLLFIFNYYKPPLNRELFITRVTSENFNLIRPTNSELYLKLVAAKTLLEIGVSFTEEFLQLIQFHATTLRPSHEHQKNVLETLRYFINGYGENLEKFLIQIVQILLRCLDPNELALRKNSHKYVSVILSNMVKIFPMVAFHYDTQRLAVGTHDGPIGIYDVRTSAKWKILEGHTKNVTCLCFDSKGNYLVSYSAIDLTLKLWKVGNTSFFATIMGGTGRYAKQIKLTALGAGVPNPHIHQQQRENHIEMENRDLRFEGTNVNSKGGSAEQASLQGGSGAQMTMGSGNRISRCHIKFLRNDKDVELIREDGSKELHALLK